MLSLLCFRVSWHMYRCVCVCACARAHELVFVSACVFAVIAQKMPVKCKNPSLSMPVSLCVRQCPCTRGDTVPDQSHWKQQLFLLSPNQREEGSVTMSPAVWADGLFKSATDNSSSATTLPHALIASNEVMKENTAQPARALLFRKVQRHLFVQNVWQLKIIGKQVCPRIFQECQLWSNEASLGMLKAESAVWQRQLARIIGKKKYIYIYNHLKKNTLAKISFSLNDQFIS